MHGKDDLAWDRPFEYSCIVLPLSRVEEQMDKGKRVDRTMTVYHHFEDDPSVGEHMRHFFWMRIEVENVTINHILEWIRVMSYDQSQIQFPRIR